MGSAPLWLALAFAFGMTIAFGLTITSSVRLRRRDLALLKILGFTRRQMRSRIAWQASASVATGVIVGIPLGILVGSRALDHFLRREIYAVPFRCNTDDLAGRSRRGRPRVGQSRGARPQHLAARTPAGIALRAE